MLFRSVLFSSASHLAYEEGRVEFEPHLVIQPVLRHLNEKIQEAETFTDTTIAIVSCLAMVEVRSEAIGSTFSSRCLTDATD